MTADIDYSWLTPTAAAVLDPVTPLPPAVLQFSTLADLCAAVDAAGPRRFLVRGIWPAGAYGVHAAEPKAGKTWNALDLAVSVASGTPWLGQHPVDTTGPVVVYAGEGGAGNIVRRIRAIATSRGLRAEALSITVCTRAPHLADSTHLEAMAGHMAAVQPVLIILDPLYLAAGGANGADLYAMGQLLEGPQLLCEEAGASLVVVTHFNRSRDLKTGPGRISGAGPAEWGRVLITAKVVSRRTDPETSATTVLTDLDVQGGEVPDQTIRVRRLVRALDPDDLDSAMEYRVDEPSAAEGAGQGGDGAADDLAPAARKILQAMADLGRPATSAEIVDRIAAEHGHGLTRETMSRTLNDLERRGLVEHHEDANGGRFATRYWLLCAPSEEV